MVITHHAKPRYVLMSIAAYERLAKGESDPRRAWRAGEAPPELADKLLAAVDETLAGLAPTDGACGSGAGWDAARRQLGGRVNGLMYGVPRYPPPNSRRGAFSPAFIRKIAALIKQAVARRRVRGVVRK